MIFNVIPVAGAPYGVFWKDNVSKIAYVVSQPDIHSFAWGFTAIDFVTGSPAAGSFVGANPVTLTPLATLEPSSAPFSVYQSMTQLSCIDNFGRIWEVWNAHILPGGSSPSVLYFIAWDPIAGVGTQQLTSYAGLPNDEYTSGGIWSFFAGGINYIWCWVLHAVPAEQVVHVEILIFNSSSPSYNAVDSGLDGTLFYPAPIFDGTQFAYVIVNRNLAGDEGDNPPTDDGSFSLMKYNVMGGSFSEVATYSYTSSIGSAIFGIYDNLHNRVLLYTSQGGLISFDTNVLSFSVVVPAGTFATTDPIFPQVEDFAANVYYSGDGGPGTGLAVTFNPVRFMASQMGVGDVANCTLFCMDSGTVQADHNGDPEMYGGIKRLNLDTYSLLDVHFPQNEWLSGNTSPAAMTTDGFLHVSALNSLLWLSTDSSAVYQLEWPSQGTCAGGGGGGGGGVPGCPSPTVPLGNPLVTGYE